MTAPLAKVPSVVGPYHYRVVSGGGDITLLIQVPSNHKLKEKEKEEREVVRFDTCDVLDKASGR